MTRLALHPVMDPWLVAAVVVVLLGLLLIRPRHRQMTAARLVTLSILRLLVVLLVLLAMLRPTLVYMRVKPQQASLALLVDDSRSMQVEDSLGDTSRWQSLRSLLEASADDLAKLGQSWDVKAYQFDDQTRKLDVRDGRVALPDRPDGQQTALGAAINDVLDREASGRLLAVLLLSDGAQRAMAPNDLPPQVAVRRLAAEHVPLYTFTFGKSGGSERADLAIDDLVTNETVYAGMPTEVRGQLSAHGYAGQRVTVQLLWESTDGMKPVDAVQLDTGVEGVTKPVVLHYTPRTPGEYKVTLRVEPRDGELVTTNNEVSTFVTVRRGGINVLYLAGTDRIGGEPGPQQRFVRAALARSPDVVVDRRLVDYQPPEMDLRDELSQRKFDVVILDDVDSQGLSMPTWKSLAERVGNGMGLMMAGGYHSLGPGGFRSTPLADVLPIDIGPAQRQNFGEPMRQDVQLAGPVRMQPAAPLGTRSPIMQIATGNDPLAAWNELPPLDGANLITRNELKPGTQVLAEADDAQRHPLLVAGQYGDGRVLAFAGDSTWRWQMQGFGDAHQRFWRQCVLWLAKNDEETEGRVWIRLAGRRALRGARVDFTVGAEDAQHQPIADARFDVSVQTPEGHTVDVRPVRSGDEWGAVFRETATPGDYRIKVTGHDKGGQIGTAEARFLVPEHDIELDRPAAEPTLMAQLSDMTADAGGAALAPEELPTLMHRLASQPPKLEEEVIANKTYWDTWPFFLVLVGLLGVEWYLRKRWGLV
jgi:uncharacterized membrane protein